MKQILTLFYGSILLMSCTVAHVRNASNGQATYASLDALGVERFSSRAPTSAGRSDIVFDGEKFVCIPPDTAEQLPVADASPTK